MTDCLCVCIDVIWYVSRAAEKKRERERERDPRLTSRDRVNARARSRRHRSVDPKCSGGPLFYGTLIASFSPPPSVLLLFIRLILKKRDEASTTPTYDYVQHQAARARTINKREAKSDFSNDSWLVIGVELVFDRLTTMAALCYGKVTEMTTHLGYLLSSFFLLLQVASHQQQLAQTNENLRTVRRRRCRITIIKKNNTIST